MTVKVEKQTGFLPSFDGTNIYYEQRGSGEPIVFVYGIACLINHWNHQITYFSKSNSVIAYDLRGHHQSESPKDLENLSLFALGKDLKNILDHFGLEKAHFVGHSFGAQVLLQGYELYPEIFKSLTLINGFAKNPIKGMFGLDAVESLFHIVRENYEKNPELWKTLWKAGIENPISLQLTALAGGFNFKLTHFKDVEIYARGVANIDLGVFLRFFEALMQYNGEEVLKQIQVPTLIISGEDDKVTPMSYQEFMHEKIVGSEFMKVPYGSHCCQLDFPDYVNLRIEKFINSIK